MEPRRTPWSQWTAEAFMIVLSVLLALFLNESRSNRADRVATKTQLEAIRGELESNRDIVRDWRERHERIAQRLSTHRATLPEPSPPLFVGEQLRIDRLFGESLLDSSIRSTAWETARTTGIVQNLDLPLTAQLTDVYSLQEQGPLATTKRIADVLFDRPSHRAENLAETLVLLEMLFAELRGQEALLLESYDATLGMMEAEAQ